MKSNIYFDDVVFKLQRFGGISRYWSSVTDLDSSLNIKRGTRFFLGLNMFGGNKLTNWLKFIPIIYVNSDIYHSSYQRPLLFKGSTKIVVTIHDLMYEIFGKGLRSYIHTVYTKWAIRQADEIICVSHSTKDDLLALYPNSISKRVRVIHNGTENDATLNEVKLPNKDYLLYVGNRVGCKNFIHQIQAVAEYCLSKDLELLIVGGSPLKESEIKSLEDLFIYNRTTQCLDYSDEEVRYLMKNAFALLFMSTYEGFGIPILESFRIGCPVLCLNNSSIPEIVGSEYKGMFDRIDPKLVGDFLDSLSHRINRSELERYMFERSRNFSWQKSQKSHLELYRELL